MLEVVAGPMEFLKEGSFGLLEASQKMGGASSEEPGVLTGGCWMLFCLLRH